MGFSHHDRRVHRLVTRRLGLLAGLVVTLVLIALVAPFALAGTLAVVALAALGLTYVAWSDRLLARYAAQLRSVREGTVTDGFLRAEALSSVGLERTLGRPSERSPHTRRRRSQR